MKMQGINISLKRASVWKKQQQKKKKKKKKKNSFIKKTGPSKIEVGHLKLCYLKIII